MGYKDRKKSNLKRMAISSSVAAAAGYLAGVLTAPKSGKQTRGDIKHVADKGVAEAEKDLKKLNTDLGKMMTEAKSGSEKLSAKAQKELSELLDKAKDTREKGREMLSAVHEGDAEDKDLARAIKDANAALKHLRDYLKK